MRIAKGKIAGDLVPRGGADLVIAVEPLESLRYLAYLKPKGILVTAAEPYINMPNYPNIEEVLSSVKRLPYWRIIEAAALAKETGLAKAVNTVMIGAASCFLPLKAQSLEKTISDVFSKKDAAAAQANVKAFRLGQEAVKTSK
jgi:indolepyruvate ferredoxin oxidoreductase beta subunit